MEQRELSLDTKDTLNNTSPGEQFSNRRLYVEFRVYFDPRTNQELLTILADKAKDYIYDLFDGIDEETSGPLPSPHDVTYELVMEVTKHG